MRQFGSLAEPELVDLLKNGAVGVIRTDTLYGLVAKAADEKAVARVYSIKRRADTKPPIVLISSTDQLLDPAPGTYLGFLKSVWPGPNSIIMPAPSAPLWLTRGTGTVAYRIPDLPELTDLIAKTGPLIAPSANYEGEMPAMNIEQATSYFADEVDFYVDGGEVEANNPSALYKLDQIGSPERLR